jgi:hypothetical protein
MLNPVPLSLPPKFSQVNQKNQRKENSSFTRRCESRGLLFISFSRDICLSQQCRLPYDINPFKDEVLCDISPLEVCDVLLGQPYLWKRHVVYESRPRSVIITLGRQLYNILEVVPPTAISLISTK